MPVRSKAKTLKQVESRLLWLSHWMIHHANNIRENDDGVKVGGHQASSASMVSLITALYFGALRPEDRVAVKPHASPIFHAMQYLVGNVDLERMQQFRGFGGVQSYPSRTKDIDDVDFSTGSVGLGVAITSFASMMQDYVRAKPWGRDVLPGRMIALMGDAELDEGNIYECLRRDGSTIFETAGGSSTITGNRLMELFTRASGNAPKRPFRPLDGISSG